MMLRCCFNLIILPILFLRLWRIQLFICQIWPSYPMSFLTLDNPVEKRGSRQPHGSAIGIKLYHDVTLIVTLSSELSLLDISSSSRSGSSTPFSRFPI